MSEEQFAGIADFPFQPHYVMLNMALQMHYVDEGDAEDPVILLLHGEPSWSYLYRHMIPVLAQAGYRVVAPDLIGFGKSSKFTDPQQYSYAKHLEWIQTFIDKLDLQDITLFCQDWGGLLGLRLLSAQPERFVRVVAANTSLPTAEEKVPEAFRTWLTFSQNAPRFDIGRLIDAGTKMKLSPEVIAAYDAPFPEERMKAGARIFPSLVPITPDDPQAEANRAAWTVLETWDKPFLTLFGAHDPITKGAEKMLRARIPGAQGQPHAILDAGHFIQEEKGPELAQRMLDWMT